MPQLNFNALVPEGPQGVLQGFMQGRAMQQREQQAQQQAQQAAQALEVNQMKLEALKRDKMELSQLQERLAAMGQDPDPDKFLSTMIQHGQATGNLDLINKGLEGRQRYAEIRRAESLLRRYAPELYGEAPAAAPAAALAATAPAAPAIGTAPGMLGSGTFGMVEPANALTPAAAPAAPANALAPAAADPVSALRMQIMALRSANDPRTKALADIKQAELAELLKTQVVSPGQTVFRGGVPVLTLPERPERPKLLTPEEEAQKIRIAAAGRAAGTTVVMPPQEKAEKGERGKLLVKQYEDISNAARLASRTLPALESNLAILDKQDFSTGFGTEAKAAGAKVLGALGVKDAEKFATDAQTFLANATQAVLQRQLEQKGPQTEADAQRITQTGAQLGNTKDANRFVLSVARAQLQRDIEQRNFYDKWWKDKGTYDGAEDAWLAGAGGKSLFDTPALKAFGSKTATGGGAAASSVRSQADAILRGGK